MRVKSTRTYIMKCLRHSSRLSLKIKRDEIDQDWSCVDITASFNDSPWWIPTWSSTFTTEDVLRKKQWTQPHSSSWSKACSSEPGAVVTGATSMSMVTTFMHHLWQLEWVLRTWRWVFNISLHQTWSFCCKQFDSRERCAGTVPTPTSRDEIVTSTKQEFRIKIWGGIAHIENESTGGGIIVSNTYFALNWTWANSFQAMHLFWQVCVEGLWKYSPRVVSDSRRLSSLLPPQITLPRRSDPFRSRIQITPRAAARNVPGKCPSRRPGRRIRLRSSLSTSQTRRQLWSRMTEGLK